MKSCIFGPGKAEVGLGIAIFGISVKRQFSSNSMPWVPGSRPSIRPSFRNTSFRLRPGVALSTCSCGWSSPVWSNLCASAHLYCCTFPRNIMRPTIHFHAILREQMPAPLLYLSANSLPIPCNGRTNGAFHLSSKTTIGLQYPVKPISTAGAGGLPRLF